MNSIISPYRAVGAEPASFAVIEPSFDHDHLPPTATMVLVNQLLMRGWFGNVQSYLFRVYPQIVID
jgi:hypothetical protein